jgi:hypothetical protein
MRNVIDMRHSIFLHKNPILNVWILLVDFVAAMIFPHPGPWRRVHGSGESISKPRNDQPFRRSPSADYPHSFPHPHKA